MTTYLIDPKAPLLFRDGRPFGAAERAETLPFPLPSTVVGALRGAYGDAKGLDFSRHREQVMRLRLAGLLPARRHLESGTVQPLFIKPADAQYRHERPVVRLRPIALATGEGTDLPHGLLPLGLADDAGQGKPQSGAAFWHAEAMQRWLAGQAVETAGLGVDALPVDTRTHVAMDDQTFSNRAGQLFQTTGLDFGPRRLDGPAAGWEAY